MHGSLDLLDSLLSTLSRYVPDRAFVTGAGDFISFAPDVHMVIELICMTVDMTLNFSKLDLSSSIWSFLGVVVVSVVSVIDRALPGVEA